MPHASAAALIVTLLFGGVPAVAGPVVPSTEEAIQRGLVYPMPAYPQRQGLLGFGCGFADLDEDGDADVILLGAADGHIGIFENLGPGLFIDRSAGSGLPALTEAAAFAAGDYDSDGDLDLYVTQLGPANVLARNDGGFQFTVVTNVAGVGDNGGPGQAPCFGDYDDDGRLDLYVCNYNGAIQGTQDHDNKLYHNLGDGTFEEVSVQQTVDDFGYTFQAVWTDFDRDGDVDLYTSNDRGHLPPNYRTNQLWRNDGGQLVNVSIGSGADQGLFSMGVACGDFNGNGYPDLYCTNIADYRDGYNRLLLNLGNGTFIEASAPAGVGQYVSSWGAIFYDFDNSGHLDLYVNNMFEPNHLFRNNGIYPCEQIGAAANVQGSTGVSFASAVGDVDGDGDLDLLVNNLGGNVQLFINHEGEQRSWIRYRVVGDGLNRHAIGAAVETRVGATWQLREVLAGGNGYLGQNELTLHVGLGAAATIVDEVVCRWPSGGPERTLVNLPANETWTLYPPSRLGDADGDGQVRLDDFFAFASCYDAPVAPGCEVMDLDGDSQVAAADFDAFLAVYDDPIDDCDGDGTPDLEQILLDPGLDADGDGALDACACAADVSGDGGVDVVDLLALLSNWGPCPGCPADLDGNDTVDVADLLAMLAAWGPCD